MNNITINEGDEIFATGVRLRATKVVINNVAQVRWIAVSFEEESYFNGKEIDVYTYANTPEKLFVLEDEV